MTYPVILRHSALLQELDDEIVRAQTLHGPMANPHEAYAVILEVVEEYWDWVKTNHRDAAEMRKELIQIAAMAIRAIIDTIPAEAT